MAKKVLSLEARKKERADYTKRPDYVAFVSIRAADVMSVEDLPADNVKAGIGKDEPLKINIGSVVQIRNVPRAMKVDVMRSDLIQQIQEAEDAGTVFITFPWIDPNMKRSI